MSGFGGGIAGLGPNYSFHEAADWVDLKKPPGHTSTSPRTGQPGWWYSWPKIGLLGLGLPFVYSPNLVWFAISLAIYVVFPYDMTGAAALSPDFIAKRCTINMAVGMCWYGYWHISLYWAGWGSRKYNPNNEGPSKSRLFHNIWYCFLGMLQWTAWEVAFVHMFATGKAPHTSDAELFASVRNFLPTLGLVLALPVLRDFHFYFAHRLIHVRALYVYVHSLHHRNSDPEPFSGMCMHPVEHIYYLSCAALSLYVNASPFLVTWNLIHAVLAPAAGHSGYEDHWQSDQFHHLHHQYFECNYGNIGFPFDKWFGTIRHHIGDNKDYVGEGSSSSKKNDGDAVASKGPSLKYLRGGLTLRGALPNRADHLAYWVFTISLAFVFGAAVFGFGPARGPANWKPANVAFYIALGPACMALLCGFAMRDKRSPRWPFHKEGIIGSFGWHLCMCVATVVLPTYHAVETLLSPPCHGNLATLMPACW